MTPEERKALRVVVGAGTRLRMSPQRAFEAELAAGDEPWHGTENGWTHHDCRCGRCREARRAADERRRRRRQQRAWRKRTCPGCGEKFVVDGSKLKARNKRWCKPACAAAFRMRRLRAERAAAGLTSRGGRLG